MFFFLEDLEKKWPRRVTLLKNPKSDLASILGYKITEPKLFVGEELHQYLVKKLITSCCLSMGIKREFTNLESVLDGLKSGYDIIKTKKKTVSLFAILHYGDWLNISTAQGNCKTY